MNKSKDLVGKRKIRSFGIMIWGIVRFALIFGLAFLILKPFITKIFMATMNPDDLLDPTIRMIPKHLAIYYWQVALDGMALSKTLFTSISLSLTVSLMQLISSALIGYGLARYKFKGRSFLYVMVILIMLIPPQTYSIAQYLGFRFFGVGILVVNTIDTLIPIFITALGGIGFKQGLYIYLFMTFFKGLPRNLEDAAFIDGAGPLHTFWSVILPNSIAVIFTVILFSFSWQWTDTTYPQLYFINLKVISSTINQIYIRIGLTPDPIGSAIAQNAACMLLILPLLLVFAFGQKYLTQSITRSGFAN